ncbi:unnamed protein product [Cladocopium goreaui]|uniref:Retrovirus-related Pol polyprotein from transposon RE1 (Retro element 1) (AtRE1) n=1 Tax=Cladocopium goreaui TaxID=2562237 RepID=A0A9P1G2Z2_9DINO|nr:unnamed protein product [Cladocopium goreaui]
MDEDYTSYADEWDGHGDDYGEGEEEGSDHETDPDAGLESEDVEGEVEDGSQQPREGEEPAGQAPSSPPVRHGKNGPRSTSSVSGSSARGAGGSHHSQTRSLAYSPSPGPSDPPSGSRDKGTDKDKKDPSDSKSGDRKRPRGNLPPAPVFTGDVKTDPKCFKKYVGKVDSYVELARMIIDDKEIGLRLHAALDGAAADYLEDVPAKTFGGESGWKILMKVLKDKFDQPRMQKVGSAMKSFFKLQLGNNCTMREACDMLDKAHRQCRDTGLTVPDAILIHWFFEHAHISQERQANLLLRTNGEYNWKLIKQAVELLYPNVYVGRGGYSYGNRGPPGKGRSAHEAHATGEPGDIPTWDATEDQLEGWLYENDPVEALAEVELCQGLPEEVSRELHQVFATHRENRQKLAKAVKARGFYVSGGNNSGKGKKGKSGKPSSFKPKGGKGAKGGGKARGMSLDELKAVTACADCEQIGHWKGDPECPKQKRGAHEAAETMAVKRSGMAKMKNIRAVRRTSTLRPYGIPHYIDSDLFSGSYIVLDLYTRRGSIIIAELYVTEESYEEAKQITRHINALKRKSAGEKAKPVQYDSVREEMKKELESDDFLAGVHNVKQIIEAKTQNLITDSDAASAVCEAVRHYKTEPFSEPGSAFALLKDKSKGPDIESLRSSRRTFMTRRVHWEDNFEDEEMIPDVVMDRQVRSLTRRTPTVQDGRSYLTIDTACENTVCGMNVVKVITQRFFAEFGVVPKLEAENEKYCFGPGDPIPSTQRLSLPIGIMGHPMIIKTSVIELEPGRPDVPFLAGQDWLLFVQAIIDVGNGILRMPQIGIEAPLLIDRTGHLVVAIDEFPKGGWPSSLVSTSVTYEGALFKLSDEICPPSHRETYSSSRFDVVRQQVKKAPNYHYEPNQDEFNLDLPRGPCVVPSDYWEFKFEKGIYIRHHCRPRRHLFTPEEDAASGPELNILSDERVTNIFGLLEPLQDVWKLNGELNKQALRHPWVGQTIFYVHGKPPKLDDLEIHPHDGLEVVFPDGISHVVAVKSLTSLQGHKKIQHFDMAAKPELFEHIEHFNVNIVFKEVKNYMGKTLRSWARMVMAIGRLWSLVARWTNLNKAIREFKHRSPALVNYMEALMRHSSEMPATIPPTTTKAAGQTSKVLMPTYPLAIPNCPHEVEAARRLGNAHGRFQECMDCGLIRKALTKDYTVPISKEKVVVYPYLHGYRQTPGAKATKFVLEPKEVAYYGNLENCYSLSSSQASGVSINEVVNKKKAPKAKPKSTSKRSSEGNTEEISVGEWEDALMVDDRAAQAKMTSSTWPRRTFGYDIIEIFGGTSMVSLRAGRNWNLRVLQPIDIRYGVDLRSRRCRRWLLKMLDVWNPRLALVEYPCTPWTILQRNCNYRDNMEELYARQEADRPFLKLCKEVFKSQRRRGGHALCENPATADSQHQPETVELREEFYETTSCLCQFGMVSARGWPMKKRVRFIATHKHMTDSLNAHCPGDHQHDPVAGRDTAASAAYTPDLADAICRAYLEIIEEEDFGRKHTWETYEPRRSYFVDVDRTEDKWRPLFDLVQEQLARKAKRVRPGMTECHRASVLMTNEDHIIIETEYIPDAQAPRERFVYPVRWAIFILGHAPGEPKEPSPAAPPPRQPFEEGPPAEDLLLPALQQEGLVRQDFAGECWFVGPPLTSGQKKLAPALVRMHRNLGHPRKEDFVRALAQQDRLEQDALVLARRLRCATCERTRRPLPPRPSSLKSTPAFNTKLSLDFVYLHDSNGEKFHYLHILDPAGAFNVFALVKLDRDGSFEGVFYEKLTDLGLNLDYIPAEAHWQAGDVEAFNRAFRNVANKLIDEYQIQGEQDMRMLGASVAASRRFMDSNEMNNYVFALKYGPAFGTELWPVSEEDLQWLEDNMPEEFYDERGDPPLPDDIPPDALHEEFVIPPYDDEVEMAEELRPAEVQQVPPELAQPPDPMQTSPAPSDATQPHPESPLLTRAPGTPVGGLLQNALREPDPKRQRLGLTPPASSVAVPDSDEDVGSVESQRPAHETESMPDAEIKSALVTALSKDKWELSDDGQWLVRRHHLPRRQLFSPLEVPGLPVQAQRLGSERHTRYRYVNYMSSFDQKSVDVMSKDPNETPHSWSDTWRGNGLETAMHCDWTGSTWFRVVAAAKKIKGRRVSMTRKEQKALDREIPYHLIPEDEREAYHEALCKEWSTWERYAAVKVLDKAASEAVEKYVDKNRILDTRVCYRNKNAAFPWMPPKHKARLVCRGDRDPDITSLRRDAPTMSRMAMMVLLQVAAAMPGWFLFNADITGAFLQGDQSLSSRKEALYLRQPREGLPGLQKGQLMLVVRGIFGLANSPRLFWRHLRDTLLKIGFRQSTLDRAVFFYYKEERLVLVLGAHVDDLLGTGQPGAADEVLAELRATFDFGAWADSREDEVLEYGGKQIRKLADGTVLLNQEKFIRATSVTAIPKWRTSTPNSNLLKSEMTELRSVGGCLHWVVGQTRPDLAAGTSLHMSGTPTVTNLLELNKLLKVCSVEGDVASLVDWRSHKIKRQCRSTLAAETMSLDAAVDSGLYTRELLAEMLVADYVPAQSGRLPPDFLPMHAATDCRSLYDLLVKDGSLSTTQEKRLAIDLGGLRETAAEFDEQCEQLTETYKWVDTKSQLADHLTKPKPPMLLRELLDKGKIALQTIESTDSHEL